MTEGEAGPDRGRQAKTYGGVASCAVGLLLGIFTVVSALQGGDANISAGALGVGFCILGYFLDSRKLATATIFLCTVAILVGLAALQHFG